MLVPDVPGVMLVPNVPGVMLVPILSKYNTKQLYAAFVAEWSVCIVLLLCYACRWFAMPELQGALQSRGDKMLTQHALQTNICVYSHKVT